MSTTRQRTAFRICEAALERPAESRAAYLAEACGGDDALRREVESLLAQASGADSFIETPALEVALGEDDAPSGLAVGQRLGTYHVVSWLGAGGMGEVYRARDTELGRDVALKVLSPTLLGDPERLARFEREARVLASLNHPNVGAIYGLATDGGVRALVLELVDGPTLGERLTQGPLPLGESLAIAMQVAEALEAAHEAGIVHRDLKPANIKITPGGAAKVLDFGLAKLTRAADRGPVDHAPTITVDGTQPGLIIGTAAYMSPEQARGLAVDKRTDIWAFGCVLYEMLTGRRAFEGEDNSAVLARVLERDPNLTLLPANTPSAIRRLLWRCLQKDRKRRLPDIAAARLEIDDAESLPDPVQSTAPSPARRAWVPWAVAGAALLAAAIAIAAVSQRRARDAFPDRDARSCETCKPWGLCHLAGWTSIGFQWH
jgi:serine/threonine protein kinase